MVALSATGHRVVKNVLNGLPEFINKVTLTDNVVKLFDFNIEGSEEMNVWDGQVFAPYFSLLMHDNSTLDYKVAGSVRKTLHPEVIGNCGYLEKNATMGITNAFILKNSGNFRLKKLMEISLREANLYQNDG